MPTIQLRRKRNENIAADIQMATVTWNKCQYIPRPEIAYHLNTKLQLMSENWLSGCPVISTLLARFFAWSRLVAKLDFYPIVDNGMYFPLVSENRTFDCSLQLKFARYVYYLRFRDPINSESLKSKLV